MVIIYTTSACPYCKVAKEYFQTRNISYQEKNVEQDNDMLTEMIERSGQMSVPVIEVHSTMLIGFDKQHLDELIGNMTQEL
jgi:glutaredoxin-like YruB-family protein